ncbi:MAG: hypothetical protein HY907_04280 [Deltaproteobacteria bacterium]|nr:hypothetical protein [Deltaproteobacteria bacterium]
MRTGQLVRGGTAMALLAGALVLGAGGTARAAGTIIYNSGPDAFEVADIDQAILEAAVPFALEAVAKHNEVDLATLTPEELAQAKAETLTGMTQEFAGFKFGYMCQVFGLFWAYFHWWDCKPVFFKETGANEFTYLPADEAAAKAEAATEIADPEQRANAIAEVVALIKAFEQKGGGKKLTEAFPLGDAKMGFWRKNGRWVFAGVILLIIAFFVLRATVWKKEQPAAAPPGAFPPAGYPPPGGMPPAGYPPANVPPGT